MRPGLPICLHLDHGDSFELCKSCIDGGFTSVMIDASSKPFEENIAITRQVVEYAHDHGVVVEAELGTLAGIEDEVKVEEGHASYTGPKRSRSSLSAPARLPGHRHRHQPRRLQVQARPKPQLRFDMLEAVEKSLPGFPIVLHGASSVPRVRQEINEYGGNMPGAHRRARGPAASGCPQRRLQDQHRLRPSSRQ